MHLVISLLIESYKRYLAPGLRVQCVMCGFDARLIFKGRGQRGGFPNATFSGVPTYAMAFSARLVFHARCWVGWFRCTSQWQKKVKCRPILVLKLEFCKQKPRAAPLLVHHLFIYLFILFSFHGRSVKKPC